MLNSLEDDVMVSKLDDIHSDKDTTSELPHDFLDSLLLSDQTKIQFIKEELAAGTYQIDSERIAARLTEYNKSMMPELA